MIRTANSGTEINLSSYGKETQALDIAPTQWKEQQGPKFESDLYRLGHILERKVILAQVSHKADLVDGLHGAS